MRAGYCQPKLEQSGGRRVKEKDLLHTAGGGWYVCRIGGAYHVMRPMATHAQTDCAFPATPDGFSLAVARCKYMARPRA
jgi:hypothetical protein